MNLFLLNLILAISWSALAGSFTLSTLAVGFVFGFGGGVFGFGWWVVVCG